MWDNQEMMPKVTFSAKVLCGIVVLALAGVLVSSAIRPSSYTFLQLSSAGLRVKDQGFVACFSTFKQQCIFRNILVLSIDFGFRMDGLLMKCSKQIKKNLGSLLLTATPQRNTREYFPFSSQFLPQVVALASKGIFSTVTTWTVKF